MLWRVRISKFVLRICYATQPLFDRVRSRPLGCAYVRKYRVEGCTTRANVRWNVQVHFDISDYHNSESTWFRHSFWHVSFVQVHFTLYNSESQSSGHISGDRLICSIKMYLYREWDSAVRWYSDASPNFAHVIPCHTATFAHRLLTIFVWWYWGGKTKEYINCDDINFGIWGCDD